MNKNYFIIRGPKPPCGPNCEKREVGCHGRCERWAEYSEKRSAYREERHMNRVVDDIIYAPVQKAVEYNRKHKTKKRRSTWE